MTIDIHELLEKNPITRNMVGSRTEYPTSGIPNGGNAQRLECPTLNFVLGIHDNTPRIPNDAIPNHGIPNIGMSSNYIRYNM